MEMKSNSEVSIFDAGRNLIQENWSPDRNQRWSSSSSVCNSSSADGIYNSGAQSVNATPTYASSEASSISQKALIINHSMPVNLHVSDKKECRGRRKSKARDGIKWLFQQRCLCSGKKCIQVKREVVVLSHNKLKPPAATEMYLRNQIVNHKVTQRAKERDQMKVQNSPRQRLISSPLSSHYQQYQQPPLSDSSGMSSLPVFSNPTTTDDDVASDASSDLFEIESFSTHTTYCPPDESQTDMIYYEQMIPSIEYCYYEPSEASIGWSITMSEGFDLDCPSMSTFSISDHQVQERSCHRRQWKEEMKWTLIADQKPVSIVPLSMVKYAAEAESSSGND